MNFRFLDGVKTAAELKKEKESTYFNEENPKVKTKKI